MSEKPGTDNEDDFEIFRIGPATYAGTYRNVHSRDGRRRLQVRQVGSGEYKTIAKDLPRHVIGAYHAAQWLGV